MHKVKLMVAETSYKEIEFDISYPIYFKTVDAYKHNDYRTITKLDEDGCSIELKVIQEFGDNPRFTISKFEYCQEIRQFRRHFDSSNGYEGIQYSYTNDPTEFNELLAKIVDTLNLEIKITGRL